MWHWQKFQTQITNSENEYRKIEFIICHYSKGPFKKLVQGQKVLKTCRVSQQKMFLYLGLSERTTQLMPVLCQYIKTQLNSCAICCSCTVVMKKKPSPFEFCINRYSKIIKATQAVCNCSLSSYY